MRDYQVEEFADLIYAYGKAMQDTGYYSDDTKAQIDSFARADKLFNEIIQKLKEHKT